MVQQLGHAARFSADDDVDRRLEKLEALLAHAGDNGAAAAPLFATLLSLDGTSRYGVSALTPQQRRSRTLAALIDQLAGLAGRKPVLWLIEDAHWIDPTTLELIELALDRVQNASVLLLITMRPTFVPGFASHPVVTRLALNRLARAATQAIVARITHGKRLPDVLLEEIAAKTDGVPLFVEEMTKAVIESGALRETADIYYLDGPLSALAVPATLHDSLMARLDRLHGVKEVAQTAAVIGRTFDHATIVGLAGLLESQLTDALQRLLAAELVFRRGSPPNATYLFKHALVRDAAYESLLKTKRIALHARLLGVLEHQGDTAPEVKAQHAGRESLRSPSHALEIEVEGIGGQCPFRAPRLDGDQLRAQLTGESRDDFVLHVEEFGQGLVEALGPEVTTGRSVDKLRIDTHPIAATLHGAFEHIPHAEFKADLLQIDMLSLVGEGRVATNSQRTAHARQVGGQAFGHAIDKVFQLGIAAYVREGQNHNGAGLLSPMRPASAVRLRTPSKAR